MENEDLSSHFTWTTYMNYYSLSGNKIEDILQNTGKSKKGKRGVYVGDKDGNMIENKEMREILSKTVTEEGMEIEEVEKNTLNNPK